jgi:broad specificity phosphatase PhoE
VLLSRGQSRLCHGFYPAKISFFLQNIHINPRRIWLTRHAESVDQSMNILGRDCGDLTETGRHYCILLSKFIKQEQGKLAGQGHDIVIMAGTQQVHVETCQHLASYYPLVSTSLLNELRGGDLDGWSRDDIRNKRPDVYEARCRDKLNYRYCMQSAGCTGAM